jgi:mannose-6-phosphate isomerase
VTIGVADANEGDWRIELRSDRPVLLTNRVQRYLWGSLTSIPELLGVDPDGEPQAELWIGAHPLAPSTVNGTPLTRLIEADPVGMLGERSLQAFGPNLPFLLKVLAAAQPLSLQAHPSIPQAVAGFEREEAAGMLLSSPSRVFKDRNHKPELICALTDFEALCGFRPAREAAELFEYLGTPTTVGIATHLRSNELTGRRTAVEHLLSLSSADARRIVNEVAVASRADRGAHHDACRLAIRLAEQYPGDPGVVVALLLNHVTLKPGEALVLGAGNLHAYLCGTGVELMANSDNVLRGGLTRKHVDVPGLISILDWATLDSPVCRPERHGDWDVYPTPAAEFELHRSAVQTATYALRGDGPQLLWCASGHAEVMLDSRVVLSLVGGQSAFLPAEISARTPAVSMRLADGTVFRALVPA